MVQDSQTEQSNYCFQCNMQEQIFITNYGWESQVISWDLTNKYKSPALQNTKPGPDDDGLRQQMVGHHLRSRVKYILPCPKPFLPINSTSKLVTRNGREGNESYKMKRKPFCRNGGYKMGTSSVGVGGKMVRSLIAKCLIIPSEDKYKRSTRSIP